jgi:hypothetical protein
MIGHFPPPFPDETLYSLSARYSDRVKYSNAKAVLEDLFGTATATAVIDLPNRIDQLAGSLPPDTSLSSDHLIDRHTVLPFFAAFLPSERVTKLRRDMKGFNGPAIHTRSGMMASRIPGPTHLRYCPSCVEEDKGQAGEVYWHRLHQLAAVEICPLHDVFLETSNVSCRAGRKHHQFISIERATISVTARYADPKNRDHRILLQVARDAEWLLEHPSGGVNLKALHGRYLHVLIERGFATHTGSIHVKKFLDEFSNFYSPVLLRLLNCELRGRDLEKSNWLLRLVRPLKHAQHPLYHLLLIQFLGCTVDEYFQLAAELNSFGAGPWPCLNPAASHYRQPVIMKCQSGDRLRYGKPTWRFSCECGFAYVRTGPDSSPEDKFRVGRIISFGQTWDVKLKQLWRDSSLSISEIGRRLSVDPLTVRRHAARLKLPLYRSDKRLKPFPRATQLKGKAVSTAWGNKRHRCRSRWLSAIKQGRQITLKALRRKFPREYAWLLHNDSEWLEEHKPQPKKHNLPTASVDWKRRDAEYAAAVRAAASRLKDAPGRPVQVTRTAIGRTIGAITLLQQKLYRLPLTAQALSDVSEAREDYAIRRVWWAAELYYKEGVQPRKWQLILRANVYSLRKVACVECAIEEAIQMVALKPTHTFKLAS